MHLLNEYKLLAEAFSFLCVFGCDVGNGYTADSGEEKIFLQGNGKDA